MLVGALNMGEYAYDFTGENVHDGPSHNPHDPRRMTGGSSGGSGGAVARRAGAALARLRHQRLDPRAVLVLRPVRAEADLRPALARAHLSVRGEPRSSRAARAHARAISRSPMTRCRAAIREDPVCADRPVEPATPPLDARHRGPAHRGRRRLFPQGHVPGGARPRSQRVAAALGANGDDRDSRGAARARRGLRHHRERGREPASRPPAHARARFRSRGARPPDRRRDDPGRAGRPGAEIPPLVSRARCSKLFDDVDAILAPATPCTAPAIGQQTFVLDGVELPVRPIIGIYTQPISFIGLPVVAVPVPLDADADRRADHRRAVAGGHRAAHRLRARTGGRSSPRPQPSLKGGK